MKGKTMPVLKLFQEENSYKGKAAVFHINVKKLEECKQLSQKPKPVDKPTTLSPDATQQLLNSYITFSPSSLKGRIAVENKKERDLKINKLEEELRSIFPKDKQGGGDISAVMRAIDRYLEPEDVIAAAAEYIRHERANNHNGKFIKQLRNWLNHYKPDPEEIGVQ